MSKKYKVSVNTNSYEVEAVKPETAIMRCIRAERQRLKDLGKTKGKKFSLMYHSITKEPKDLNIICSIIK